MADRIPLIVNANVNQLQELPNQDDLVLSGQLKMTGTASGGSDVLLSGGNDGHTVITVTGHNSNVSKLTIDGRGNAGGSGSGNASNIAEFIMTGTTAEFVSKGEITAVQPTCLLTVPKEYVANNGDTGSGNPQEGGTNEKPISFTNTTTNVNCTTSLASNATVNSGISSITVPSAGTYLVSASISVRNETSGNTNRDQIRLCLGKTGITTFPSTHTFPADNFGNQDQEEANFNFAIPLPLSASDTLSIHFSHIGASSATVQEGYFSVVKLH